MGIISGLILLKKMFMIDNTKQTFFNLFAYVMAPIEFIGKNFFWKILNWTNYIFVLFLQVLNLN